jgi:hypothetical protein
MQTPLKMEDLLGNSSENGPRSIAMLNYQRVNKILILYMNNILYRSYTNGLLYVF